MLVELKDRVVATTTTTGTGTYALGNAVSSGYQGFGVHASGARVSVFVQDFLQNPTQWEIVEGIYTAGSPATLTRAVVKASSNGGAAVNWAVGTKYVIEALSSDLIAQKDYADALPLSKVYGLPDAVWPQSANVDPGTTGADFAGSYFPAKTRTVRGVATISGLILSGSAASIIGSALFRNASNAIIATVEWEARGQPNTYASASRTLAFDVPAGTITTPGWHILFRARRNNPVNVLDYTFSGYAVLEA